MIRDPLKIDPTRTATLRKKFISAIRKRMRGLKREIFDFLVMKNALDLKSGPARNASYPFNTDPEKLQAFNDWFTSQVAKGIFIPDASTPPNQPWTTEFIYSAYRRGLIAAYLASRTLEFVDIDKVLGQSMTDFLNAFFAGPVAMSKVRLLALRTFEDLKGVTAEMSAQLSRVLAQGMIDGTGAIQLAREMSRVIDQLSNKRAFVMARTEIIRAHAEGQLDALQSLGVTQFTVKAEWSTAGDDHVCARCEANEGKIFTLKEARGLIPLHPNCRCSWIPYLPKMSSRK